MTNQQKKTLIDLLWDYLQKDKSDPNRVQTGWGTKTKEGIIACIESLQESKQEYAQVVVCVYGGLVQEVLTDKPDSINVDVVDIDRSEFETQDEKEEVDERVKKLDAIRRNSKMKCVY